MKKLLLSGPAIMLAAMASFSVMNTIIAQVATELPTPQMVLLRNALGLCFMLPFALSGGRTFLRTTRLKDHALRSIIGIVSMELWFYAMSVMPVTQATALSFTTPIFTTVFAILFLNEKVGYRRWSAIACGLIGALIIIRPGFVPFSHAAFIVLGASAMMASAGIVVKTLTRSESPLLIVFYMTFFMSLLSAPLGLYHWQPLNTHHIVMLGLIALSSIVAQVMMAYAYQRSEIAALMPFDFTRLVFTAIIAYLWFGETLDTPTILGAGVIAASTIYITRREARLKHERNRFDGQATSG